MLPYINVETGAIEVLSQATGLRFDSSASPVLYLGEAPVGSASSAANWRIMKIDTTSGVAITWAGTGVFNQIWDNRASLTYV